MRGQASRSQCDIAGEAPIEIGVEDLAHLAVGGGETGALDAVGK